MDVEVSYAWDAPWHRGRVVPTLEMQLQRHMTAYRVGTRWEAPGNLQLRLLGERREGSAGTPADHALLLEGDPVVLGMMTTGDGLQVRPRRIVGVRVKILRISYSDPWRLAPAAAELTSMPGSE